MHTANEKCWRESAFVTPQRAAHILGYSICTVRTLILDGGLKAVRMAKRGPMFVTVESLIELIDSAEPLSKTDLARLARGTADRKPALLLIAGGRK
jgi:hypothetical protein